jgi:hypothetical protein
MQFGAVYDSSAAHEQTGFWWQLPKVPKVVWCSSRNFPELASYDNNKSFKS